MIRRPGPRFGEHRVRRRTGRDARRAPQPAKRLPFRSLGDLAMRGIRVLPGLGRALLSGHACSPGSTSSLDESRPIMGVVGHADRAARPIGRLRRRADVSRCLDRCAIVALEARASTAEVPLDSGPISCGRVRPAQRSGAAPSARAGSLDQVKRSTGDGARASCSVRRVAVRGGRAGSLGCCFRLRRRRWVCRFELSAAGTTGWCTDGVRLVWLRCFGRGDLLGAMWAKRRWFS